MGYHLFAKEQNSNSYLWNLSSAPSVQCLAAQFGYTKKKKMTSINVPENLIVRPSFKYMFLGLNILHTRIEE